MKRFLLFTAALLGVLVAGLLVLDVISSKALLASSGNSAYKMCRLFDTCPENEIPILGSSRAALQYVPPELSPLAFNYGQNNSSQAEIFFQLQFLLAEAQSTPVIVNLDPWGFPKDEATASFVGDFRLVRNKEILKRLPEKLQDWRDRVPGIRFYGTFKETLTSWLNQQLGVTRHIVDGALLEINSRSEEEWAYINAKMQPRAFYGDEHWKTKLQALMQGSSRPVIWVVAPCSPRWKEIFPNKAEMEAFLSWLAQQPHQTVINLFDLPYENALFVDPTHLNEKGAYAFTAVLRERLLTIPSIASWFAEVASPASEAEQR